MFKQVATFVAVPSWEAPRPFAKLASVTTHNPFPLRLKMNQSDPLHPMNQAAKSTNPSRVWFGWVGLGWHGLFGHFASLEWTQNFPQISATVGDSLSLILSNFVVIELMRGRGPLITFGVPARIWAGKFLAD